MMIAKLSAAVIEPGASFGVEFKDFRGGLEVSGISEETANDSKEADYRFSALSPLRCTRLEASSFLQPCNETYHFILSAFASRRFLASGRI